MAAGWLEIDVRITQLPTLIPRSAPPSRAPSWYVPAGAALAVAKIGPSMIPADPPHCLECLGAAARLNPSAEETSIAIATVAEYGDQMERYVRAPSLPHEQNLFVPSSSSP